jgi:hypothetical protein
MPAYLLLLLVLFCVLWVLLLLLLAVWPLLLVALLLLAPVADSRAASRVGGPTASGRPSLSTCAEKQHARSSVLSGSPTLEPPQCMHVSVEVRSVWDVAAWAVALGICRQNEQQYASSGDASD